MYKIKGMREDVGGQVALEEEKRGQEGAGEQQKRHIAVEDTGVMQRECEEEYLRCGNGEERV